MELGCITTLAFFLEENIPTAPLQYSEIGVKWSTAGYIICSNFPINYLNLDELTLCIEGNKRGDISKTVTKTTFGDGNICVSHDMPNKYIYVKLSV